MEKSLNTDLIIILATFLALDFFLLFLHFDLQAYLEMEILFYDSALSPSLSMITYLFLDLGPKLFGNLVKLLVSQLCLSSSTGLAHR